MTTKKKNRPKKQKSQKYYANNGHLSVMAMNLPHATYQELPTLMSGENDKYSRTLITRVFNGKSPATTDFLKKLSVICQVPAMQIVDKSGIDYLTRAEEQELKDFDADTQNKN